MTRRTVRGLRAAGSRPGSSRRPLPFPGVGNLGWTIGPEYWPNLVSPLPTDYSEPRWPSSAPIHFWTAKPGASLQEVVDEAGRIDGVPVRRGSRLHVPTDLIGFEPSGEPIENGVYEVRAGSWVDREHVSRSTHLPCDLCGTLTEHVSGLCRRCRVAQAGGSTS